MLTSRDIDCEPFFYRKQYIGGLSHVCGYSYKTSSSSLCVNININSGHEATGAFNQATNDDQRCRIAAGLILQQCNVMLNSEYSVVGDWTTIARNSDDDLLSSLATLVRYAGDIPLRDTWAAYSSLAAIKEWISADGATDGTMRSSKTEEARSACQRLRPYYEDPTPNFVSDYYSFGSSAITTDQSYEHGKEMQAAGRETTEGIQSDVVETDDPDMKALEENLRFIELEIRNDMDLS